MGHIVITGASSEIGLAITEKMSGWGKPLLLQCNKNPEKLSRWASEAQIVAADFSSDTELDQFIARLQDVDILIYAAAYTDTELIPQISEASIRKMIQVNLYAFTRICQTIIPSMCLKRNGILVNISSATASRVYRGQAVYAGTKAYMEAFSKAIVAEYGRKGIRCNCVAPGSIQAGSLKLLTNIAESQVKQINAMSTLGVPEDVANAVAFLCRPESSFINGTTLHVDGGHWMGL
jgi:3-oxoacyl-[acyl-carrier protein] reductase